MFILYITIFLFMYLLASVSGDTYSFPDGSKFRGQVEGGVVWGAQIEGEKGYISDKIARRWSNLLLSAHVLNRQNCSLEVCRTIVGTWTCSMLYRRSSMSIFDAAHRELAHWGPHDVKNTPWRLRQERLP